MRRCRPSRWHAWFGLLCLATAACGSNDSVSAAGCAGEDPDCSLAVAATEAGLWLGAAIADPQNDLEQTTIGTDFNSVTAENAMKWGSLAPTVGAYDFTAADAIVDFAAERRARLRGHVLVWRDQQPADLRERILGSDDPPATARTLLAEHVGTVVDRYRGRVAQWDVVNEPLAPLGAERDRSLFQRVLGDTFIDEAFALARAADPDAQLFLNEFFYQHRADDARVTAFRVLVQELLDRGVALDGIGIQGHFFGLLTSVPQRDAFAAMLRSFTDLGVAVEITEVDVSIRHFDGEPDPLAAQARVYGDIVAACRAVAGCLGITTWGMADSSTWLDRNDPFADLAPHLPLLLDGEWMRKPAYDATRAAVLGRWD